ncbi:GFA family protein [Pseudemcibacter aquimaris]|uniref:GFA family protein n=1 Tax=Pseudemcibacter aquimaris TaxID=2857064 RepID=UPI002013411F|nr:GFA family protein [Pseudemcibacter aquimaris]MCC3861218.1 GFA family protein [Pseudemcibacter aquimaris]WDU57993.1 GFA family protein [Pseudemcibacter aquimaris]
MSKKDGSCLCGKVTFTTTASKEHFGACHCAMCRKWSGAPFMEIECGSDIEFSGTEYVSIFKSSEWAERAFCKNCGSHLYYKLLPTGSHYVSLGLFDGDISPEFSTQVFIDKKPDYYNFKEETATMTEAEILEMMNSDTENN